MRGVLAFAAVGEIATGVALLVVPSLAGQLLLGTQLAGIAIPIAHVTGIALIALGIACWPATPLVGMLVYSTLVTLYLAYLGVRGETVGPALWPAVALHAALAALLSAALRRPQLNDPAARDSAGQTP